jgi:hypothetical protein
LLRTIKNGRHAGHQRSVASPVVDKPIEMNEVVSFVGHALDAETLKARTRDVRCCQQGEDAMPRRRIVTQRLEDCIWSAPVCRLDPMSDRDDEFESFWVCERTEVPIRVTQAVCAKCRHWSPERGRATDSTAT